MSQLLLYRGIKQKLKDDLCDLKHIALFNNQFERFNVENPFLFPCAFIEFKPSNYKNFPFRIQEYDLTITVHIGWESYKEDDEAILEFKQEIYKSVHGLQVGNNSLLLRSDERPPTDYGNFQDYEMDFTTRGMDYDADTRATKQVLITPQVTAEIVKPDEL